MIKVQQTGRGMIEILGVLAIIALLSVGAFSGISRAILKNKLNKQSDQVGYVIEAIIRTSQEYNAKITPTILRSLGVLTQNNQEGSSDIFGLRYFTTTMFIPEKDSAGNPIVGPDGEHIQTHQGYTLGLKGPISKPICLNLANIAQNYSDQLAGIGVHQKDQKLSFIHDFKAQKMSQSRLIKICEPCDIQMCDKFFFKFIPAYPFK